MAAKRYPGLKASDFVYPRVRKYPINTLKRARAALSYSAHRNTYGSYATVARAVRRRYGSRINVGSSRRRGARRRR